MLTHITHILLDAARLRGLLSEAKARNKQHDSLYRGGVEAQLTDVAPYIFRLAYGTPFADWYFKTGWGAAWGVMIKSSWPLPELHTHFRKFLIVKDDTDRQLYLRFYDPRVLRTFLATCDPQQLREFFGNAVDYFILEDEDPAYALRYRQENGILKLDRFAVADVIACLPDPEPISGPAQDELPPETIAALTQQGLLEQVLAGMRSERRTVPAPVRLHHSEPAVPALNPSEGRAPEPASKRKWHMFD